MFLLQRGGIGGKEPICFFLAYSFPSSPQAPRFLLLLNWRSESNQIKEMGQIQYSDKYFDDIYEYRHVVLPPEVAKLLPKNRLLSENEWRAIGVQQSRGWVHYAIHKPEPHIMLFRRPLNYQQQQENQALQQQQQQMALGAGK
ncbi:hypothetical protein MRB53_028255 [Persea americana]|uniref:Uncharacterized protein n=1 Tax=Persea americana TaxID=3435 RepID=A0ACC2KF70_PERAE|nr:hypothetical protein MRB53_028255 [Persea americana]